MLQATKKPTMPPQRKKRATTQAEAMEEGQTISTEPTQQVPTDKEERYKRIEEALRARSLKAAATQDATNEDQPQPDTEDEHPSDSEDELASVLRQLEEVKRQKERYAQKVQAQREAANRLTMLNEAKKQLQELQRELQELENLRGTPQQPTPPPNQGLNSSFERVIYTNPGFG